MQIKESDLGEEALHSKRLDNDVDDESEYETLSLSDLPLYSDHHLHHPKGESNLQDLSENAEDFDFEFSSQEFTSYTTTNTTSSPKDDIVFCGKLITYKPPQTEYTDNVIECKDDRAIKKHKGSLFKWNCTFRRSSTTAKREVLASKNGDKINTTPMQKGNENQASKLKHEKERCGYSGRKVSILTPSTSGKVKWYLFLFGISSFTTKTELGDMKSRLRRNGQSPSRISPAFGLKDSYEEEFKEMACKEMNRRWGFLELLKSMNCGRS